MKSKKLISLLCAAAMSVSAFAGLATTASAAATPVWTFDGSSADDWEGTVTPTVETDEGSTDNYLNFAAAVGKASNDTTFVLPTAAQLTDDYVLEYDTYIHGGNGMGRLNHYTQVAFAGESPVLDTQTYGGDYATAAEAINPDPDHHWSQDENTGNGYTTDIVSSLTSRIELSCQGKWVINQKNVAPNFATDGTTVGDDKWVRVRAEVKGGKAKVTIADSNQTYVDGVEFDADATKLAQIKLTFGRADGVNFVPTTASTIKLDNIKVYDGIAGTPAFSTDGLRKTAVVATPVPRAENVAGAAPNLYAPEGAIAPYKANFDDAEAGTILSIDTAAQDPKPIVNGLTLNIGNRPDGADTMSYGAIVDVKDGSKALKLQANNYATNGRGPIVSFDDDLSIDDMTGTTSVLGFSVYLSRTAVDGIERLFLIDNTENVDGNSCARDVVAVLTTEEIQNEDGSYKYTAGESNIGVHLDPEKWNTVALAISENEYRLFVNGVYRTDGNLSPALKNDLVGTGEGNKNAVKHLPMFAIENTKASTTAEDGTVSGGTVFSSVLIDNVLTYQIQAEVSDKLLPTTDGTDPSPAPTATATPQPKHDVTVAYADGTATVSTEETDEFDAVVVAANYNAAHQLDKIAKIAAVKVKKDTPATVTGLELAEGDKIMVWNSVAGMIPYGAHTVTAAEANATQPTAPPTQAPATPTPGAADPTPTPGAVTDPTATPGAVTDPTPTPGAVTDPTATPGAPTATPGPTATPAPKSAVTVASATNGTVKVMDGTTELDATALAAVEAGKELTIVGTPNAGYAVKTITVAPTNTESTTTVAVTNGKFTMPAEAVTVTVEFEYNGVFKITPAMTYVNFQTAEAETSFEGVTPAKAGLVKISGGKFMESAQNYLDTAAMTVISIDASEYLNKIDDAVLTFGGKSNGAGTTVRYGTYSNYIDIASDDVTVSASNVNTLGGTPAIVGDVGAVNTTDVTKLSLNIKDMLKGAADGKVTIVLLTSTGRATDITDPEVTVTAAETAYETATVNVHTVYEDANGAIEANGKKYTEFGTAKTATMYAGDKYTAGHTAVIDNKNAETAPAKYTYASGDEEITAVAGNNDIYLVYTRELYSVVTFTAKVGETATAGVPIVVTKGADAVGTFTTAAAGENTTEGVISTKLLPGTYSYTVAATANYSEITDGTFTVGTAGEAVPVAVNLQANTKASATLKVVYTTDGTAEGKVGEVTVYNADANKFEDDVVSADDLASYRIVSKIANAEGLYGLYTYTSGGDQAVTLAGGENIVYITVTASEDTRLFNVYENFEDGVNKFIDASRTSVYVEDNTVVNSKVQAFRRAGNAQNGYGLASFALPTTLNKAKTTVEFDAYIDGSNSREIISIRAVEGGTTAETTGCSKVTYGSKGVMFNMGQTWSQTALLQGATVDPGLGKWVHVQVIINTTTKKVSYTITEKESGNAVQSATDVAYVDTTTETTNVGYIDVFGGLNNYDKTRIDNIIVINEDAE